MINDYNSHADDEKSITYIDANEETDVLSFLPVGEVAEIQLQQQQQHEEDDDEEELVGKDEEDKAERVGKEDEEVELMGEGDEEGYEEEDLIGEDDDDDDDDEEEVGEDEEEKERVDDNDDGDDNSDGDCDGEDEDEDEDDDEEEQQQRLKELRRQIYTLVLDFPSVMNISQYDVILRVDINNKSYDDTSDTLTTIQEYVQQFAYYNETAATTSELLSSSNIVIPQQNQGSYRCEFICEMFLLNYIHIIKEQHQKPDDDEEENTSIQQIQQLLEQTYRKLFEYIDPDYQRTGTFLLLVDMNNESESNINIMKIVELPVSWSYEFLRQQYVKMENTHTTSLQLRTEETTIPEAAATTTETNQMHSCLPSTTNTQQEQQQQQSATLPLIDESIKRRRRSSLLRRSLSSGDVFEDFKKRMSTYRDNIILSDEDDDDGDNEDGKSHRDIFSAINNVNATKSFTEDDVNDDSFNLDDARFSHKHDDIHHNSSSSLKSNGSVTSFNRMVKKIASPFRGHRPILQRSPSWSEGVASIQTNYSGNIIVHTANALDVIFMKKSQQNMHHFTNISGKYQLIPNYHTGNSRIHVMVQMDLTKYVELRKQDNSIMQIRRLIRDIVEVVKNNFKGRFLMESDSSINDKPEKDGETNKSGTSSDYFVLLTDDQAIAAVECIFQAELIGHESTTPDVSTTNVEASNISGNEVKTMQLQSKTESSQSKSFSTAPVVNKIASFDVDNIKDMHKATIMALQRRKKRQGVNKKISKMASTYPPPIIASHFENRSQSEGAKPQQNNQIQRSQSFRVSELLQPITGSLPDEDPMVNLYSSLPAISSNGYDYGHLHSSQRNLTDNTEPFRRANLSALTEKDEFHPINVGYSSLRQQQNQFEYGNIAPRHHRFIPDQFDPRTIEEHRYYQMQQMQQMQLYQQQQLYNVQTPPEPIPMRRPSNRRRSTLSQFSQDMIQDMLLRAHTNDGDNDLSNDMELLNKMYGHK